ncbi:hypothetical protein KIL84_014404 [Mauremys mutica]|uniref:Uncharacterized protein n=1 Tax=Mauremys mutica TaxID=74926 RepID=A0A9D3XR00_9SAUR|nr:hypothetical protein KIL84_014404 [Mauremys mutica]
MGRHVDTLGGQIGCVHFLATFAVSLLVERAQPHAERVLLLHTLASGTCHPSRTSCTEQGSCLPSNQSVPALEMELSFVSRLIESRGSGPGCQSTSALAPEVLLRLLYCVPSTQLRNKANAFQKESSLFLTQLGG